MKFCKACNASIANKLNHCPLCYTTLVCIDGPAEVDYYPDLTEINENRGLMIRILIFMSISIIAVCATVNFLTKETYPWWLIVALCVVYVWIALGTAIKKRHKLGFNLLIQLVSLGLALFILSYLTGIRDTLFNYIFPALAASAMLSFNILAIVLRKQLNQLLLYYLIVGLIGFLPLILMFAGYIDTEWTAIITAVYCGLSIISVFIFAYRSTKTELKKRFHI